MATKHSEGDRARAEWCGNNHAYKLTNIKSLLSYSTCIYHGGHSKRGLQDHVTHSVALKNLLLQGAVREQYAMRLNMQLIAISPSPASAG
jgi:hypothetical protein